MFCIPDKTSNINQNAVNSDKLNMDNDDKHKTDNDEKPKTDSTEIFTPSDENTDISNKAGSTTSLANDINNDLITAEIYDEL